MPLESAIRSHLSGFAGLTALVPATKILPGYIDENLALPAVTFFRLKTNPDNDWTQLQHESVNVQISVFATSAASALAIVSQVRAAMATFTGSFSGLIVNHAQLENQRHLVERDKDGGNITHHMPLEFSVSHQPE